MNLTKNAVNAAILLGAMSMTAHAASISYVCEYQTYSNESGNHKVDKPFELTFIVDESAKKAYMVGNNGSTEVLKLDNMAGASFLEVTDSGNAMVTAIAESGESVHSRSPIMGSKGIVPSQYYGKCDKK